jgi:hypothetical protein
MSLLDTASLIVTPNGYKEGTLYSVIPSDGSGDMSVTRATTATRVNSAGLVELVPYNLFKYSEQFDDVNWDKSSGAITANATTAPNGTTTADLYTANGSLSNHDFFQGFTGYAKTTSSIYVKKNTAQFVYISLNYQSSGVNWATGIYDLDNLTTATFQSGGVTNQIASISDEGNGWCRITLSVDTADTALFCMYGVSDSMSPTLGSRGRVENSSSASFYAWGAQLVEGSVAKDYQKTETRLNIPRLDYSNGTCPSLLVEPQRTNQYLKSNDFANWSNNNGTNTITPNYAISPDGIMNASRWVATGTGYRYNLYGLFTLGTTTVSIYAKRNNSGTQKFGFFLNGSGTVDYELNLTNEWQRFTYTFNLTNEYQGLSAEVGADVSIYGYQLEAGSYPTSYIPTTSASVTRNADVISKTGISSLIGQTEGVVFWEGYLPQIADAGGTNISNILNTEKSVDTKTAIAFQFIASLGKFRVAMFIGNGTFSAIFEIEQTGLTSGQYVKIAFAYKTGDSALYINGSLSGTSTTSFTSSTQMAEITLNDNVVYYGYPASQEINATALWKTRLTNTQLAALTTI